jgi:hypothetical protein
LLEGALARRLVGPPAQDRGAVAKPLAAEMIGGIEVERDLAWRRPMRIEKQIDEQFVRASRVRGVTMRFAAIADVPSSAIELDQPPLL